MTNGVPVFSDWLDIKIRRNRKSFVFAALSHLALVVLVLLVGLVLNEIPAFNGIMIFALVVMIPLAPAGYLIMAQRLRDINISGWAVLLYVPFLLIGDTWPGTLASLIIWVVVASMPGTKGANRYGPDPLEQIGSATR